MVNSKDLKEQTKSLNVLYAEDEEILREGMESTLSKFFKNVYSATNGQEAFYIFKKENIDIVITDINMPIMSGTELINDIKKYTDEPPAIIVISAHNEASLLISLINMGVDGFLNKPLDKQYLINTLYKTCRNINNEKLIIEYQDKIQSELDAIIRKNRVLEKKQNQLSALRNKEMVKKSVLNKKENTKEEKTENYYETLLIDDKEELYDLSIEIDSFITMVFNSEELDYAYIEKLSTVYRKYASVLNSYPDFSELAISIDLLSQGILTQKDTFLHNTDITAMYLESMQVTLENFRHNIWNKQAVNPRFYNASLINDINIILNFLNGVEVTENEIDFF